ncbi:hypothetical protein MRX96_021858 [Rhipicephalus microplus]
MGYVFCLVIFQSGNRRKLKLATGAYSELVEKLTGNRGCRSQKHPGPDV